MKSTEQFFFRNIFVLLVFNLMFLSAVSIYLKHVIYHTECFSQLHHKIPDNINLERVSIGLWLKMCDGERIFIGSSESTGENSIPDLIRNRDLSFSQFTGAHRGIKTYAFISSLDLHQSIVKESRFLVLLNPIYFTEGPAKTAPSMGYRTAVTNAYFNQVVGTEIAKPKPIIDRPWVALKNTFDEIHTLLTIQQLNKLNLNEEKILQESLKSLNLQNSYNLKLNLKTESSHSHFTSKISFNTKPTKDLFLRVAENKNKLQQCIVLLPMNRRFFYSQNADYIRQIDALYNEIRHRLSKEDLIDLSYLDSTDYIFTDIMHFTNIGSVTITKKIVESECFSKKWL